ncbi:MAG: AAA family ATPase, partial [Caldilineaceae bacterium]|nr:AAA family ATPase [Caldilineaceae bacterium]
LAQLRSALATTESGVGQIVAVVGQAGVGKSRLVAELKHWYTQHSSAPTENALAGKVDAHTALWLEGRGLEYASTTSYSLFADLFRGYWGVADDHGGHRLADNLQTTLDTLAQGGFLERNAADELGPLLGKLLAVDLGTTWDQRLRHMDPNQLHQRMVATVKQLLIALARRQSVVLIFEDLQWADTLSLEVITALLDIPATVPILLLCLYRPEGTQRNERLATLARQHCPERFTEIRLSELTPAQSRKLLTSLLRSEALPPHERALILREAQGNPLFLEEIVRALIDSGQLYRVDESWQAHDALGRLTVPETLQRIVTSRVDRLPTETCQLLQQAAVLGRIFPAAVLAAMNDNAQDTAGEGIKGEDIEGALDLLTRRSWIYLERSLPEAEYSFHHVLVRDAIYQELPPARRRAYHGRAAAAIETLTAANREPVLEQLAYHCDQGDLPAKAVMYLLLAGQKAQRLYANDAALAYFRRAEHYLAQDKTADPRQRLALLDGIGQVYVTLSDLAQGEPYLRQAIALAKELALPPVEQARRYFPLCHLLGWFGDSEAVRALTAEGLALLNGDLRQPEAIMLLTFQSEFYFNRGKHRSAMALFAQVVEQLPELGYDRQLLSAYNMVAMWCRYTKAIDQGFDLLQRVEAEATAQGDLWTVGYLHGWPIMFLHETVGNLAGVIHSLEKF